jgi:uncharacterized protein YciI
MESGSVDLSELLGRDYWVITSHPEAHTTAEAISERLAEHVAWLLSLEDEHVLLVSGPLLAGPGVGPGSGMTVLRAKDEVQARLIAGQDPFVQAGLRTFEVHQWRLNEGSVSVRVSLGTGRYDWY